MPIPLKPDIKSRMSREDVVGAAPTTSEWSTMLLLTNVSHIRGLMVCRNMASLGQNELSGEITFLVNINAQWTHDVIMSLLRKNTLPRRFDVIMTFSLRRVSAIFVLVLVLDNFYL